MSIKSKDAKRVLEFDITPYTKGFVSETTIDGDTVKEYFQYKQIHEIIHHVDIGVEIVGYNHERRVFYNDDVGKSLELFTALHNTMISYMNSNLN